MTQIGPDVSARLAELLTQYSPTETDERTFLGAQFDLGLAWCWRPEGLGGCGASAVAQAEIDHTLHEAGAPSAISTNPIGVGMAAPTLFTYADAQTLSRLLRPLFTGEEIWCQMFSEPDAGSDLAALSTRAVLDGDEWIVNGQKIWTSLGHRATWGLLLARTDPSVPKHRGLSYFFVRMASPGVQVRPLRQATGDCHFNEVFFDDARVPNSQLLGGVGQGWRVAITTLMNERVSLGRQTTPRGSGAIADAVTLWNTAGRPAEYYDRLMQLWSRSEALRLLSEQQRESVGGSAGPNGSISKLARAEITQEIFDLCMDLLGAEGMLYPSGYAMPERVIKMEDRDAQFMYVRSMATTIAGGTSDIMRNILGERVLGLPAEPRVDKDAPWTDVPR